MLRGTAEPPTISRCSAPRSQRSGSASSDCRTAIHTVGTPADIVTRSLAIRSRTLTGSSFGPGSTSAAPANAAAYGVPHALAWNIGTTGRIVSRPEIPSVSGSAALSECSTSDRWEYTTPFGRPVVPDV